MPVETPALAGSMKQESYHFSGERFNKTPYCSQCGAKMDAKERGNGQRKADYYFTNLQKQ